MTELKPEITCIQTQVNRGTGGLSIESRTIPAVEEFFRNISGNTPETIDMRLNGRFWQVKAPKTLIVYALPQEKSVNGIIALNGVRGITGYRLDRPGQPLLEVDPNNPRGWTVNISFLRLVGISEGGIEFTIRGVYSEEMIRNTYDAIIAASAAFYESFLKPIHLSVVISTQEY